MKRIITTFIVGLLGLSALMAQPIAENGYFYNDFSSTGGGMSFAVGTGTTVPGFATISGGTNSPLIYHIGSTLGNNTDPSAGGSGASNFIQVQLNRPTAFFFTKQSAILTLTVSSPISVPLRAALVNYDGTNIYSSYGNYYSNPVNYYSDLKSINTGKTVIQYDFSSVADHPGFFNAEFMIYLSYNIGVNNSPTNITTPAANITFLGISLGTPMTSYDLTYNDISATLGQTTITPYNLLPSGISGASTFIGLGSLNTIASINSVDGISGQLVAKNAGNGTVSVTGISRVYPYMSKTIAIGIVNNPPVAPTSISIDPSVSNLGRGDIQTLSTTISPSGAYVSSFKWISSDPTKVILSVVGAGAVAKAIVITTATSGIVTITVTAFHPNATVSGTATLNLSLLSSFTITSTGISPTLTFSAIDPIGVSTLGGIVWSALPTTVATINSITGALIQVKKDGVITITGVSGGITVKTAFSVTKVAPVEGITDVLSPSEVNVYPNPASTVLNVSVKSGDVYSVYLISSTGQTVLTTKSQVISLAGISKGFYNIVVETSKGVARKSVSIE